MTIQYVNIGANPNDGTGDDLRTAFSKVNSNFGSLALLNLDGFVSNAENIGLGQTGIYSTKVNDTLKFRTIAGGSGIQVSLSPSGDEIVISNAVTTQPTITTVLDNTGRSFIAQNPGETIQIIGKGSIVTEILGNEIGINGIFELENDPTPSLSGDLNLNLNNIIGSGNITIAGDLESENATIGMEVTPGVFQGQLTVNGTLQVKSSTTLASVTASSISSTSSISAPVFNASAPNGFVGNLLGDSNGTHFGNVTKRGIVGDPLNPDRVLVNATTGVIDGDHTGTFSGDLTGTLIGNLDLNSNSITGFGSINIEGGTSIISVTPLIANSNFYPSIPSILATPTINDLGSSAVFTMLQQEAGMSESIRLRSRSVNSDQLLPLGTSIAFESTNELNSQLPGFNPPYDQPDYILHGFVGVGNYDDFDLIRSVPASSLYSNLQEFVGAPSDPPVVPTEYGTLVVSVRNQIETTGLPYLKNILVASGSGNVKISQVEIQESIIRPRRILNNSGNAIIPSFNDLIFRTERTGTYINFYGDYDVTQGSGSAIGGYSFPRTIGAPGTVLTAQVGSNELVWAIPGSAGAPSFENFINLDDTPISYEQAAGKVVVVNSQADGLEFTDTVTANFNGTLTGSLIGNASTATALETPVTINGLTFNGTQNILLDTRQIEEYFQTATSATIIGTNEIIEIPGGPTQITTFADITIDNANIGPGGPSKFVSGMTVLGTTIVGPVTIVDVVIGASQTILAVTFNPQITESQTVDIECRVENRWFTDAKARAAISVQENKSLTFDQSTGVLDISESTENIANTLVKRDSGGIVKLGQVFVSTLEKNTSDTAINISSPLSTGSTIQSTANIITSATVSTGFISLTGTGDQTLTSTAKLILNPATTIDVSGKKIINLPSSAPTNDTDAANKKYVDDTSDSILNVAITEIPISGDTGGSIDIEKNTTLTIAGSTNISTSTTISGVQVNLKSVISGVTVSGNLPVTGQLTANSARGGNVTVSGNEVTQSVSGNSLNLLAGAGGSVNVTTGRFKLVNTRLYINSSDSIEIPANDNVVNISVETAVTFVRTLNWPEENGRLAFATLPSTGVENGQMKTIIMRERGNYGSALDTRPRFLQLSGNINGSTRTVNIASVDPNGSSTFIFLDNSWWRISNIA
jgi:hypothetical protein